MLLSSLVIIISWFINGSLACGMGGIGSGTSAAVIGLCIIFSPIILPVVAVGVAVTKTKSAIDWRKKTRSRKRLNSDIIKREVKKYQKQVGKENFHQHIQQLSEAIQSNRTSKALFDLGVALFLRRDFFNAIQYLDEAIDRDDNDFKMLPHAYFMRGLTNQYMRSFQEAAADFKQAMGLFKLYVYNEPTGADVNTNVPPLTVADALNSFGFANALYGLYETHIDEVEIRSRLDCAIKSYTDALAMVEVKQGMWYHNRGVARYFRTYHLENSSEQIVISELELALEDFKAAINSSNFGTAADGYSMAAQTLTRLGRLDEREFYLEEAFKADPNVFYGDSNISPEELSLPWPLPEYDYPMKKSPHVWEQKHFSKPTWCSHCTTLIKTPVGKQGYECQKCKKQVHSKCFPQVKAKNCWDEKTADAVGQNDVTHTHRLKAVHFHKPTWCDHCTKFIASPIGKQGYSCVACKFQIHKDCASQVAGFIDDN